jgi:hypothetical protein
MKNKILGVIGIICGGFICLNTGGGILNGEFSGKPSEVYLGALAAVTVGVLMLVFGIRALKGKPNTSEQSVDS